MIRSGLKSQGRQPSKGIRNWSLLAGLACSLSLVGSPQISPSAEPVQRSVLNRRGDSPSGLRFPEDRQVSQWLLAAQAHIDRQEFAAASGFLAQVFSSDGEFFFVRTSEVVAVRTAAWDLAMKLPGDLRQQLEDDVDRIGNDAWKAARDNGSREAIASFAVRHRFSRQGLDALRFLAATLRDASQHETAAAAWARVAQHPRATKSQRTVAHVARIECLAAVGRTEEALRVCKSISAEQLTPTIVIAGQNVAVRGWIESQRSRLEMSLNSAPSFVSKSDGSSIESQSDPSPALTSIWSRLTPPAAELSGVVQNTQRYFRGQGVVSSPAMRPLVVKSTLIARTMGNLIALDLNTGEPVWREPVPHPEYSWIAERPFSLENVGFRNTLVGAWHRRTEADSIFGTLGSDGQIVVAVMEPDLAGWDLAPGSSVRLRVTNPVTPAGSRWNRLVALDVSSGELRWQIGGKATGPADVYGGLRFLGPPIPFDNLWFGVTRREDEAKKLVEATQEEDALKLMAIDGQTGHLRWSAGLGALPLQLAEAPGRRRIACPVSMIDGRLICPTAGGALIAVDPVTRGISWVYSYPVRQHEPSTRPVNGMGATPMADPWWNEWREVNCASEGQVVVLASPESDELHAVRLNDGRKIWSVSRSGGLHLVGLFEDLVIVIEPMAVRAHELQSGRVRWRCETGEISGRGAIVGSTLIQPRRAGGVATIDLRSGSRREGLGNSEVVLGALVPCEGGWISQTEQALTKLPLLTQSREEALSKWSDQKSAESFALELARLDLQAGDPAAARSRLLDVGTPAARELRREATMAMLVTFAKARSKPVLGRVGTNLPRESVINPGRTPVGDANAASTRPNVEREEFDREAIGNELLALCESNDDRLLALRAIGDAAAADNDPVRAVSLYLDGIELLDANATETRRFVGDWAADSVSNRLVRRDRVLVGAIARVMEDVSRQAQSDKASAETLQLIEKTLNTRLESARRNSDPFAVQRLVDRMLPLPWGRSKLLSDFSAMQFARTLKKAEPALLTVSLSQDRSLAQAASRQLIGLFERSGWKTEASASARRLLAEFPDVSLSDRDSSDDSAADAFEAVLRVRLQSPPIDPWPAVHPKVEVDSKTPNEDVHYFPVLVDAAEGSLLDRMDVSVDRQARYVRFAGDGHAGKWTVTLPGPSSTTRTTFANFNQCEGWGVGRLLVLRLGTELFCISPLDERGEPHGKLEWLLSLDVTGGASIPEAQPSVQVIPARVGLRHEELRLVDGFGRTLGRVGPVRPDYLCFQSQARLITIDTQTGKRLWERHDIPPNCVSFGDEDQVYLWRTSEGTLQSLSAVDGRVLDDRSWEASVGDVLLQRGSLTWLAIREGKGVQNPATRIELHDARTGSMRWAQRVELDATPFVLDQDTIGLIHANGRLKLLSSQSGKEKCEPIQVDVPEKLERIVCHRDSWRWYVAFSSPIERQVLLQNEQVWGGRRLPFVTGSWYAIDRGTKSIAWKRTLQSEPIPLDASRMVPVFAQVWRQPILQDTVPKAAEGCLRLIDKRTGTEITYRTSLSLQPYHVFTPTASRDVLEVRTERESIRLQYEQSE